MFIRKLIVSFLLCFLASANIYAQDSACEYLYGLYSDKKSQGDAMAQYYLDSAKEICTPSDLQRLEQDSNTVIADKELNLDKQSEVRVFIPNKYDKVIESDITIKEEPVFKTGKFLKQSKIDLDKLEKIETKDVIKEGKSLKLDTLSIDQFPLNMRLNNKTSFKVIAKDIKRYLIVKQSLFDVERQSSDVVVLTAKDYGKSVVHFWTANGRKTLVLKVTNIRRENRIRYSWQKAQGIKLDYSNRWGGYYLGNEADDMHRSTYSYSQDLSVTGPVPIGDFDARFNWRRRNKDDEMTAATMGIRRGELGFLQDFHLRMYDVSKGMSTYAYPGGSLKGFLFETPLANNKWHYSVIYGQERDAIYGNLDPGLSGDKDIYHNAIRFAYKPDDRHESSLTFAKAWGDDRQDYITDKAMAYEGFYKLGDSWRIGLKLGYDQKNIAKDIKINYNGDKSFASLGLYDVDDDYTSVVGYGANEGRYGFDFAYTRIASEKATISFSLNGYNDHDNFNEKNEHFPNLNAGLDYKYNINDSSDLSISYDHVNNRNISSPFRQNSGNLSYSKRIKLPFKSMRSISFNTYYGIYQNNNILYQESNQRGQFGGLGMSVRLFNKFSYFANFSRNYYKYIESKDTSSSKNFSTGLSFSQRLSSKLSMGMSARYSDSRSNSTGFTLESKRDTAELTANLDYKPLKGVSMFLKGSISKDDPNRDVADDYNFYRSSVSFGTKLSWESFLVWAKARKVTGFVFKDDDGDGIFDKDEEGIPDVRITLGPYEVKTNKNGAYSFKIKARDAYLAVDFQTVPYGMSFTTPKQMKLNLDSSKKHEINFGFGATSGIKGIVFYDINNNLKFDAADIPMPSVRFVLDKGKRGFASNASGAFFFNNLEPGKHRVELDIKTLPKGFLPKVKFFKEIEVIEGVTHKYLFPLKKQK